MFIQKIGATIVGMGAYKNKWVRLYKTIGGEVVEVPEYTQIKKGDRVYCNSFRVKNLLWCDKGNYYYQISKRNYKILTITNKGLNLGGK